MTTKEVTERPMTPGERQALSRIIKNTFETLMSELETLRLNALQEAEYEFNERVRSTLARRNEIHQMVGEKVKALVSDLREVEAKIAAEGFEVDYNGYRNYLNNMRDSTISVMDRHHRELLEARKREIATQYGKAVEILRRRRLDADKDLLLTAIKTEEAKAFMESLPDAKSLFALALESS